MAGCWEVCVTALLFQTLKGTDSDVNTSPAGFNSTRHVWALLRIFKEEDHRDAFVEGRIRFNTLGFYRRIERADQTGRADSWEGVGGWLDHTQVKLTFAGQEIRSEHLTGSIRMYPPGTHGWNVCSFVALHWPNDRRIPPEELSLVREQLLLPDSLRSLGEYVAIVADGTEFLKAVHGELARRGFVGRDGLVGYVHESTGSRAVDPARIGFVKRRDAFSYQQEFRVIVERDNPDEEVLWLELSDLSTVAIPTTVDEFNEKMDLRVSE